MEARRHPANPWPSPGSVQLLLGVLALAVGLGLAPGSGAEEEDAEETPFTEESLFFAEIPSVYAASKYEQKVTEAPSAVSIVTADEIQKFGYRTLADILAALPGIFATYDRNYDYLAVRGFGLPGDYNTRVLLLVDGHRLNDPVYEAVPIGSDFPVDVDLIKQVEVVRGPSSSLYGSNAFFAVVNVVTKEGRDFQTLEASAGAGSQDSYRARSSYGKRFEGGAEVLLSASYFASDGDDHLFFAELDDPSTNDGVALNADDDSSYNFLGEFSWRGLKLQLAHSKRTKEVPTASWGTIFNTEDTRTKDYYTWADLSYAGELAGGWQLAGRAYYDRYEYDGDYLYEYPPITLNRDKATGERWGAELNVTRRLFDRHRVSLGGTLDHNFRQDQKNYDLAPPFTYLDDERDSLDWGLYLQDEVRILDNLHLNAGVRYDEDDEFGGTVNPRVALIYQPFEPTTLKFLYGRAFRAPSSYELYYNDGAETTKSSLDLDAETIETFEVVWEQQIGAHLHFAGSGYYSEIDDLIELTTDPADDLFVFRNRSRVEALGLEFRLDGQWESGLAAGASYAIQRAEDDATNSRLTNSPRHLAKGRLVVPILPRVLFAAAEVRYISSRKVVAGGDVGGALLTRLTLLSRETIPGLEVQLGVDNLFDEEYFDPASEEHTQRGIQQDGRKLFLKVTYQL